MCAPTPTASMDRLAAILAVPVYVAEDIAVGRFVFQNFIHEEFEEEGVPDEILDEVPEEEIVSDRNAAAPYCADENFANALQHAGFDPHLVARQVGANIREIANDFAKSRERERLKEEADKVDLASITYEGFFALCDEVLKRGITKENVVALFFFCADVLIKCVKSQMKAIGIRLFKWALKFIVDRVCSWVAERGGWEKAIKRVMSSSQIAAASAGAVAVVAVCFMVYRWRS